MVIGAASTRATATADLDAAFPADVVVGGGEPLPASLLGRLVAVEGVRAGVALRSATVTGPDGEQVQVQALAATAARPVLRSTAALRPPVAGEVVLPVWLERSWAVSPGTRVTLSTDGASRELRVVEGAHIDAPLVAPVDLAALAPDAGLGSIWLRLDGDGSGDASSTVDALTDAVGTAAPTAQVTGLASERAALDSVLNTLLLVVTGLLGVAVLIALLGVGNTLALSVVERRQENGLLRALGLTRGQLRGLLAWEAALVAGVASVLGVGLGAVYGIAGAASVLGNQRVLVLSVPWLQVAAIVIVATVAGLLASVLPARRAARTAPVAAIAVG
jgi:putative ABC transport system permease protein